MFIYVARLLRKKHKDSVIIGTEVDKMNKIHEHIKTFRKEKGLTQEEVAKELFVTRQLISKWEQGTSLPDIESAEKLAKIFGVSISELIDDESVKSITLKEAIKNKSKNKFIWLSISLSLLALLITAIIALLGNRPEEGINYLEGYFYVTEIDAEKQKYTFSNDVDTLIITDVNYPKSIKNEHLEDAGLRDLKIHDNVKITYTEDKELIDEIEIIDSRVDLSLYGVFVSDQSIQFDDLQDVRNQHQGVRYAFDTDGASGSNIITQFSYKTEGHYHERTYEMHVMIDPLKVQGGLHIGLITSNGITYVDEVDLSTQKEYIYEGAFALDHENIDDINSIHVRYIVVIEYVASFSEVSVYEYDKTHSLIAETSIIDYIGFANFRTNDNTLYGYVRTSSILGDSEHTYEDVDVSSILVGENAQIFIADPYGIVSKYNFHFE